MGIAIVFVQPILGRGLMAVLRRKRPSGSLRTGTSGRPLCANSYQSVTPPFRGCREEQIPFAGAKRHANEVASRQWPPLLVRRQQMLSPVSMRTVP